MPRVLPGLEVERWVAEEPDGPRRAAVLRWFLSLVELDSLPALTGSRAADSSIDIAVPGTDLVATCIVVPSLDVIVIERIGSTETG